MAAPSLSTKPTDVALMLRWLGSGLFAAVGAASVAFAEPSMLAIPQIEIIHEDGSVTIAGHVVGIAPGAVTARLEIEKSDGGGTTRTSQGREIEVGPGSHDTVATTRLSVQPGLDLGVTLTLVSDGVAIGAATTRIGQSED